MWQLKLGVRTFVAHVGSQTPWRILICDGGEGADAPRKWDIARRAAACRFRGGYRAGAVVQILRRARAGNQGALAAMALGATTSLWTMCWARRGASTTVSPWRSTSTLPSSTPHWSVDALQRREPMEAARQPSQDADPAERQAGPVHRRASPSVCVVDNQRRHCSPHLVRQRVTRHKRSPVVPRARRWAVRAARPNESSRTVLILDAIFNNGCRARRVCARRRPYVPAPTPDNSGLSLAARAKP